jgi:hypothetical protein
MLRNSLVALALTGAVVIPAGMAIAQGDGAADSRPPVAATLDQIRDRDRIHDLAECGTCVNYLDGATVVTYDADQDRDQDRDRIGDADCDLGPIRDRINR